MRIGFLHLWVLGFVVLKLTGVIDASWWLLPAPLYVGLAAFFVVFGVLTVIDLAIRSVR
jgi:hypothetical protein